MATKVINSLTFGDTYVFTTPYATSSTSASTQAKVATLTPNSNFSLETGVRVAVKFSAENTASSPTLNVNSSGAKTIQFRGAALTSSLYRWAANSVVEFMYDGTYWQMLGAPDNTNSTYSVNNATITLSAGTGLSGGGDFTTNQSSAETITFSLGDSGVTAASYGPSANASLSHSGTFSVPYVTVDKYGRVTAASTITYTLPASGNTDTYGRSGNTSSKIYLIGTTTQDTSNKTTYSHDTAYVGTDGCLYSNSTKVSVEGHGHAATDITSGTLNSSRLPTVPITKGGTGATTREAAYDALMFNTTVTDQSDTSLAAGVYYSGATATDSAFTSNAHMVEIFGQPENKGTNRRIMRSSMYGSTAGHNGVAFRGMTGSEWQPWTYLLSTDEDGHVGSPSGDSKIISTLDFSTDSGISTVKATTFDGNLAWSKITSKPSYYDAKAIKSITRSGTTFTYTCMDGTTATFNQQDNNTTYSIAKYNASGLVKPAYTSTNDAQLTTTAASNTTTPTIAAKSTTSGRYYAIEADKNGVLFVNVPWTDTNTNTDTKVSTATTTSKFYLTGQTSSTATTGSLVFRTNAYVDASGYLYSGGSKVLTSYSDTKAQSATTTSQYYLTGSTSSGTATGTLVKRTTVYVDTSANIVGNNIPATGLIWQTF